MTGIYLNLARSAGPRPLTANLERSLVTTILKVREIAEMVRAEVVVRNVERWCGRLRTIIGPITFHHRKKIRRELGF